MRKEYRQPVVCVPVGIATLAKDIPPLRGGRDSRDVPMGSGNPRELPINYPKGLSAENLIGGGRVYKSGRDGLVPLNPKDHKPK